MCTLYLHFLKLYGERKNEINFDINKQAAVSKCRRKPFKSIDSFLTLVSFFLFKAYLLKYFDETYPKRLKNDIAFI